MLQEKKDIEQESVLARRKKTFDPAFKAKVALAALMTGKSLIELAAHYDLHPCQISLWKRQLINRAELAFYNQPKIKKNFR